MTKRKSFSVVIPVYNEEETLHELHKRLTKVCKKLDRPYEIVLANDGSKDRSWEIIEELAEKDSHIKGICLSRNFGHQICLTAGLEASTGDMVVMIDADLQDPPELFPKMIKKHEVDGFDVVYAVRSHRAGETAFKKLTAATFYRLLNFLTSIQIPQDTGDFRLVSRDALNALLEIKERHRFIRGLFTWIGFKQTGITYKRAARFAGETKYPVIKMVRFAIDAITSFSAVPLHLATWMGFASAAIGFVYAINVILDKIGGGTVPGWASITIAVLFFGGVQLITLGILGEYIGRIFDEVKNRPLYFLRGKVGFDSDAKQEDSKDS